MQRFAGIIALLAVGVLLPAATAVAAEDIAAVYKRQCALCHGADGSGQTGMGKSLKLRDLRAPEVQKQSDQELFEILKKGKGKMPAYAKLGDETLHGLVKYIRDMPKKSEKK